jgi:hypothetical protein
MSMPGPRYPNDDQHTGHQHTGHRHSGHQHSGDQVDRQEPSPVGTRARLSAAWCGDLVASVPFLLRYRPRSGTAVVVAVKDGRIAYAVGVFDLNVAAEHADQAWAHLRRYEEHVSPDRLVVIGYVDHHHVEPLLRFAAAGGHITGDVLRVDGSRWWHFDTHTPTASADMASTCGSDGGSHVSVEAAACVGENVTGPSDPGAAIPVGTELLAAHVLAGAAFFDFRAALGDFLQQRRPEVLNDVTDHLATATGDAGTSMARMVDTLESERARRVHQPSALTPARAARLLHALDQIAVRDVCIGWRDDPAWQLWCDLVGYAPPGHVAPVTTLIALIAAQRGDRATARIAVEHALTDDPDYGLALWLQQALDFAAPPDVLTAFLDEAIRHPPT